MSDLQSVSQLPQMCRIVLCPKQSKGLVTIETLITILTIENLNSWQSLLPDNQEWQWTVFTILAMFYDKAKKYLIKNKICAVSGHRTGCLVCSLVHWDQWEETVNLEQRSNNSQGQVQKYKYTKTEMQKHKQKSHMCTYMCSCVIIVIWPVDASEKTKSLRF